MRPRTVELGLLVLASLITVSAYGLTSLGRAASLPADIGPFLGIVVVLLLVAHVVVRRFAASADGLLLPLAALLNGLGYVVIADSTLTWLPASRRGRSSAWAASPSPSSWFPTFANCSPTATAWPCSASSFCFCH